MIQLLSTSIEAVLIINIRFSIYIGTDRVRLSIFLKIELHRVREHELEHVENILNILTKITIIITITDKNYNYSNNVEVFVVPVSDYISVYTDYAIDKQISFC